MQVIKGLGLVLALQFLTACTEKLANFAIGVERWRSELEEKQIVVDDFTIRYLEGGSGPTVFMVHGFGADKESWTRFSRKLTDSYHVIAVDLPGFGDSSRIPGVSYSAKTQAERIDRIRIALKIDRLHIVGNSMGGMIAGAYAQTHPEQTLSLTLFNSGGIVSPEPSDYSKELKQGRNPLLIEKPEDMRTLLSFSFVHPPYVPDAVLDVFYKKAAERRSWNQAILMEIFKEPRIVENALSTTQAPMLVIWGQDDRIIHVSSTKVIARLRPDAEIHIIPECGHVPMMEKLAETSKIFLDFLKRTQPRTEAARASASNL